MRKAKIERSAPVCWPELPTSDNFNIALQGTWPDELWDLYSAAAVGLRNGDLAPLHKYLVSGYPMALGLMQQLALMIEGHEDQPFVLVTNGKKRGQKTINEIDAEEHLRIKIGLFAEKRLRLATRGQFDSIIEETMQEFGVRRTTVTKSLNRVRTIVAENESRWPGAFDAMCGLWSVS